MSATRGEVRMFAYPHAPDGGTLNATAYQYTPKAGADGVRVKDRAGNVWHHILSEELYRSGTRQHRVTTWVCEGGA